MKNRLLIIGSMCALLLSVLGCSTNKSSVISTTTEERHTIIEKAAPATPPSEEDSNLDAVLPIEIAESPEIELPVESAASGTQQAKDLEESRPEASESSDTGDFSKEFEPVMPPEDDDLRQEDTVRSEIVQQEPEPPASDEPPEPADSPAPIEPPTEPQPKSAYDYPFDVNVIHSDCIAIGMSMSYTLNASLTPQNAMWWNPITASESSQGVTLRTSLEQYIRFHTVSNLSVYGLDEITEFNICCEANGDGYTIYFVFA